MAKSPKSGKKKKPSKSVEPAQRGKTPRGGSKADSIATTNFQWRVDQIDWDGPFGWHNAPTQDVLGSVVPTLHDLETMTWADVEGPTGSHFVERGQLCKAAQDRLEEIGQSDLDYVFSVRVTGERRVWGIKDVAILRILWWDPRHEVCPSSKKHT